MSKLGFMACLLIFVAYFVYVPNVNSQSSLNYYPYNSNYSYPSNPDQENVLIILDSSYSMQDKIGNERKIDIAKRTINNVLGQLSPNVRLGLRVYGHKTGFLGFNACRASELKVPISPNSQTMISNELIKIQPMGWTPISYSIDQALGYDFNGTVGRKRIILVSDGMETCDGSPCEFAINLVKRNVDVKIDVIGFDISEPAAISQLKCTALATKGRFLTAGDDKELTQSLIKTLNISQEVQGRILNKSLR